MNSVVSCKIHVIVFERFISYVLLLSHFLLQFINVMALGSEKYSNY